MTTLNETFEMTVPPKVQGPFRDLYKAAFMAGVAAAIRELGHAVKDVDLSEPGFAEKALGKVSRACMAMNADLATWTMLNWAKVKH